MLISEAVERFMADKQATVTRDTRSNYDAGLRDLLEVAGDKPIADLSRRDIADTILRCSRAGLHGAAWRRKLDLRVFSRWASKAECLIDHNPFPADDPRIEGLRQPKRSQVFGAVPGDRTLQAIYQVAPDWIRCVLLGGWRRDMGRLLQADWIASDLSYIEFPPGAPGLKDRDAGWLCPVSSYMRPLIERGLENNRTGYVFEGWNQKAREWRPRNASPDKRTVLSRLEKRGHDVGDWRLHDFRRSYATFLESRRDERGAYLYPDKVREIALAHSQGDPYHKFAYFEHRAEALEDWGSFLVDGG
jgi:integrase